MISLGKLFSKRNRGLWITIYAIYVVFILISATAFYAEQAINSRSRTTFNYVITFDSDGTKEHYTVTLTDNTEQGKIFVEYNDHSIVVSTFNIKELTIDCRSIAKEKSIEILGIDYEDHEDYYKEYFIKEVKTFTAYVTADYEIDLTFKDVPYPSKVIVDSVTLIEGLDYNYNTVTGDVTIKVPRSNEEVTAQILFEDTSDLILLAEFVTDSDYYHLPNKDIRFDASLSEPAADIVDYLWDFDDGTFETGKIVTHSYSVARDYVVILVVRDTDGKIARAQHTVSVKDEDTDYMPDEWETIHQVYQPELDADRDGLTNKEEFDEGTDPNDDDSDDDGFSDQEEIQAGTDPNNDQDVPQSVAVKPDEEEDAGMFNLGKVAGIDIFIILILLIIIIIIFIFQQNNTFFGRF